MKIKQTYFIKIRKHSNKQWEDLTFMSIKFSSRRKVVEFCKNLANLYLAEIRLSESDFGSGTYFEPSN